MTDYPMGSMHVFTRGRSILGLSLGNRTFKRVQSGWLDPSGDYHDDLSMEEDGWRYLRPA